MFYQKAFDAPLGFHGKDDSGMYMHGELEVNGGRDRRRLRRRRGDERVTAIRCSYYCSLATAAKTRCAGPSMCSRAAAASISPPEPCDWSPLAADVSDKYGVRWCLFV